MTALVVVIVVGGAGAFFSRRPLLRWRRRRRRDEAVRAALPEAIELISVVVGSGGTVAEALRVLALSGPIALTPTLTELQQRMAAGVPVGRALLDWGDQLDVGYRPLIGALIATERDGAPLSQLLGRLADQAVDARRRQAESEARTLPVQLLFPVVFCALPAVLVGAVIPLILVSLERL